MNKSIMHYLFRRFYDTVMIILSLFFLGSSFDLREYSRLHVFDNDYFICGVASGMVILFLLYSAIEFIVESYSLIKLLLNKDGEKNVDTIQEEEKI